MLTVWHYLELYVADPIQRAWASNFIHWWRAVPEWGTPPTYVAAIVSGIALRYAYKAYVREDKRDDAKAYVELQEQAKKVSAHTSVKDDRIFLDVRNSSDLHVRPVSLQVQAGWSVNRVAKSTPIDVKLPDTIAPEAPPIEKIVWGKRSSDQTDITGWVTFTFIDASGVQWIRTPSRLSIDWGYRFQPPQVHRFASKGWIKAVKRRNSGPSLARKMNDDRY